MAEITEWKPEKILSGDKIRTFEVPYGLKQEKLISGIHYPDNSGGGMKVGHFQITATGSIAITGLGFTPTYIEIISTVSGSTGIFESRGLQSGANTYTHYNYNTTSGLKSYYVTNNIVVIEDGSSGSFVNTYASFTSFDSDGFTINIGTRNQTVECTYIAR